MTGIIMNVYARILLIAVVLLAGAPDIFARGEVPPPPPPPFGGGNAGDWLPRGPVFGFDDGGGPGGGWGGGYYGGGGWGGWGFGPGGSGGYGGGGAGAGGHHGWGDLLDTGDIERPHTHFGTCFAATETGNANRCACMTVFDPRLPPCNGCPAHGLCKQVAEQRFKGTTCNDLFEICVGIWRTR